MTMHDLEIDVCVCVCVCARMCVHVCVCVRAREREREKERETEKEREGELQSYVMMHVSQLDSFPDHLTAIVDGLGMRLIYKKERFT